MTDDGPPLKRPKTADEDVPPFPSVPAKVYPFTLDDFQKKSICWLEHGDSVLVSAHTSAGKTVVAEYAIAKCMREKKRVIYTSPIKALSNQKFRDLAQEFGDVGLVTGDVTVKPNADCLVMTTEILRSMLYRGNEMLREVGCVIFDEIHYMRDKTRGVVWEETIIMLPHLVQFVFLSATIPNAREFADWVESLHPNGRPVHVVYTDYRPTPLQHYLYPKDAEGIFCVVDENGEFRSDLFRNAMAALGQGTESSNPPRAGAAQNAQQKRKNDQKSQRTNIVRLINMVTNNKLSPCIVFSFSKRECETLATQLTNLDLNNEQEKEAVQLIFQNAIDPLADHDKKLPAVETLLPLLKRGIGIHHSGLLPIMKEVVEILFQENLVKVLFSTETFSMGLNMPARTVVFTSCKKFDGESNRYLTSGEYIQMSGRAGRRGLDKYGVAILMIDDRLEPEVIRTMTSGKADALNSAFRLTYNMVLNLLRVEEIRPQYIMSRSFAQHQLLSQKPELERRKAELQARLGAMNIENETAVQKYYNILTQLKLSKEKMHASLVKPSHLINYINSGRLVSLTHGGVDYGWGIIVNMHCRNVAQSSERTANDYIIDAVVCCNRDKEPVHYSSSSCEVYVVDFPLSAIQSVSGLRVSISNIGDLVSEAGRSQVKSILCQTLANYNNQPPVIDKQIIGAEDQKLQTRVESLQSKLEKDPIHTSCDPAVRASIEQYQSKLQLESEVKVLSEGISSLRRTVYTEQLNTMLSLLRTLRYTNPQGILEAKGRVACEVNTADELVMTEALFSGVFNDLTPEQATALLSCCVAEEKSPDDLVVPDEYQGPLNALKSHCSIVLQKCREAGMDVSDKQETTMINPLIIKATHEWVKGAKFCDAVTYSTAFEGSLIRMWRRLEELLRQMAAASRALGDDALFNKFMAGHKLLKRDIAFAASLYL